MRVGEGAMKRIAAVLALMLAGCASGPHYWTRADATRDIFLADHDPCFKDAIIGYGIGSEKAYKACMASKGWMRVQGTGSQYPTVPHFRGPEGDDEFTDADQGWFRTQGGAVKGGQTGGRENRETSEAYFCRRGYSLRPPPGVVCR